MPRPRKQEKTVDIKGSVSEATYDAIVELAKVSGISIRQLVNQVLTDYIANQNPKPEILPKTSFYVGAEADRNSRARWEFDSEVVALYKDLGSKGIVEDRDLFVAHGYLWMAVKQSNGTAHHFSAMAESPEEVVSVIRRQKDNRNRLSSTLKDALKAYKTIQTIPGYDRLPVKSRKPPTDKLDTFSSLYDLALEDALSYRLSEVIQSVTEALESLEPKEANQALDAALEATEANQALDAALEATEDNQGEVLTYAEAMERFNVTKGSLKNLSVGEATGVGSGSITKIQREDGSIGLVFIPQLALV